MKNLKNNLENSLISSDIVETGIDIAEISIDQLLNEGILKDLPIVNSILAVVKTGISIKDALYIKKFLLFLKSIQEAPEEKRIEFLNEISKIKEEKNRLFEKILFTIEKIDDSEKADLVGKAFKHLIVGNINLIQYYRMTRVIEDMLLDEINFFFYKHGNYKHTDQTRGRYYKYLELIGEENLKTVLIKNGLFEINKEFEIRENIKPQNIFIKKTEEVTKLGSIFVELGFGDHYYLTKPIE